MKADKQISLHRTAGQDSTWKMTPPQYNPRAEGLLEQEDPQPRGAGKMQRKLNRVRFESRPRKRQRPMPEDPIIVAYSDEDEGDDPLIIVAGLEGDNEQKDQEVEHTREEEPPQSPPEEEKGSLPYAYTPRSPPYPPPEDEDWDTKGMPELVDIEEDQDTVTVVPADQNADKDFFKDSARQSEVKQKYDSEIKQAPWTPQNASDNQPDNHSDDHSDNPLMKLGDLIPKATPVYEGFWKNSDMDILSRLDVASEELKAKRRNNQKKTPEESTPKEQNKIDTEDPHPNRPASPSIQMSTQDDLRDNLEDTMSNVPVEPVTPQTGPPKVIPPTPYSEHDLVAPPPQIPTNFRIKLKSVAKMRTGPPPQKAKMLVDLVTGPKLIIQKLTPEEVQELTLPPAEAANLQN